MNQTLNELFEQNKGYLHSASIRGKRKFYYELNKLLSERKVVQLKRGLYRHADYAEEVSWGEICRSASQAVVCMFSAWQFYQLTTTVSPEVHLAIPVRKKPVLPDFPPVQMYFWSAGYYDIGITETEFNGEKIKLYDLEKSVCDAVRYRNKIGVETLNEVLRNYLKRKDRNLDKLMKYAVQLRISKTMQNYIQLLL
jgi:predicted transcriptional regulator of viral defense system